MLKADGTENVATSPRDGGGFSSGTENVGGRSGSQTEDLPGGEVDEVDAATPKSKDFGHKGSSL